MAKGGPEVVAAIVMQPLASGFAATTPVKTGDQPAQWKVDSGSSAATSPEMLLLWFAYLAQRQLTTTAITVHLYLDARSQRTPSCYIT